MSASKRRQLREARAKQAGQWWVERIKDHLSKNKNRMAKPPSGRGTTDEHVERFGEEVRQAVLQRFEGQYLGPLVVDHMPSGTMRTLAARAGLGLFALPPFHFMRVNGNVIEVCIGEGAEVPWQELKLP